MLPDRFQRGYVAMEIGFFHGVIVSCDVLRKAFRDPRRGGHEQLWSGSTEQRQRTAPRCPVSHPGQVAQLCPAVEVQPLGPQPTHMLIRPRRARTHFCVSFPHLHIHRQGLRLGPDAATERVNEQRRDGRAKEPFC